MSPFQAQLEQKSGLISSSKIPELAGIGPWEGMEIIPGHSFLEGRQAKTEKTETQRENGKDIQKRQTAWIPKAKKKIPARDSEIGTAWFPKKGKAGIPKNEK